MVNPGETITLHLDGADPGAGKIITAYEWKVNGIIEGTSSTLSLLVQVGSYEVAARIQNDCGGWSDTAYFIITVVCPTPTLQQLAVANPDLNIYEGTDIIIDILGIDPGAGQSVSVMEVFVNGSSLVVPASATNFVITNTVVGVYDIQARIQNTCGLWSNNVYLSVTVATKPCPIPTILGISIG